MVSDPNQRRIIWRVGAVVLALFALIVLALQDDERLVTSSSSSKMPASTAFLRSFHSNQKSAEGNVINSTTTTITPGPEPEGGNETWATLYDNETQQTWLIRKRPAEYYLEKWQKLVDEQYSRTDMINELDLPSGIGFRGVLEMEDGRDFMCLIDFFRIWAKEEPFSGEPFFRWLDYGSGKQIEETRETKCDRQRLNHRRYGFLNETEREAAVVELRVKQTYTISEQDNVTVWQMTPRVQAVFAVSQQPVPEGIWLSVWDLNQRLHLIREEHVLTPDLPFDHWKMGHGSVLHGRPALYAGEMGISGDGIVGHTIPESGQ